MLEADALVQRRRLKRRLTVWRLLAVVLALGLAAVIALQMEGFDAAVGRGAHVARVSIGGLIRDDRDQERLLQEIAKAKHVKALILRINSPGGTTSGGEALFESIRNVAKRKPVVAVFGTVATSAAYMAGLASDHIVARGNTVTGSVGIVFQWAEVTKLLKSLGVTVEEIKSGPLKANPSPFQPTDEAGRQLAQEMVGEAQKWFLALVADRRSIDPDQVPGLSEGRIFSGRQALRLKLIDEIGGEAAALDWLVEKRNIKRGLRVLDWKKKDADGIGLFSGLAEAAARALGLPVAAIRSFAGGLTEIRAVQLDGLVSLWHPRPRP